MKLDDELKIFFSKIKNNPFLFFYLLIFLYKTVFDFIKRKGKNKFNIKRRYSFQQSQNDIDDVVILNFIKPYEKIISTPNLHFNMDNIELLRDEQYIYYKDRFYDILFIDKNEIKNVISKITEWSSNYTSFEDYHWHPYSVSERIVHFITFYCRFEQYLDNSDKKILIDLIYKHANFLHDNFERNLKHHNHLLNNSRAMLYACVFFQKYHFVIKWKKNALRTIKNQIYHQVLTDGVHSEQSSTYHFLLTRTVWEIKELFSCLSEYFEYELLLQKMIFYAGCIIRSDGSIPFLGHITPDWHWKELVGLYSLWSPNKYNFKSAYSELFFCRYALKIKDYQLTNIFVHAGIIVYSNNVINIVFTNDSRNKIASHGDQSKLGIDLFFCGTHLLRDCGLSSYNLDDNRKYFESWLGQSMFVLNKLNPIVSVWRQKQLPSKYLKINSDIKLLDNNSFIGSHNAYNRVNNDIVVSRLIFFNEELYELFIEDVIKNSYVNNNYYNSIFHFGSNEVIRNSSSFVIIDNRNKNHFSFEFSDKLNVKIMNLLYSDEYGKSYIGTSLLFGKELTKEENSFKYVIKKVN